MSDMDMIDGNYAAAHVAYALSDTAFIYPITPSSTMAELAEAWSGGGRKNCYDQQLKVTMMQSEAGAAGALHGALSAGSLATTFTASQGLLLMIPNMLKISGELMPCVIHVAARALAGQALSIFGDHQDVMAARQTGFGMLSSGSVQECSDLGIVAHIASIDASVPFVHFFEGFRLSHEISKVNIIDYNDIKPLINMDGVKRHRDRALNPTHPHLRGSAEPPDVFFQMCEAANKYYEAVPEIVQKKMDAVAGITGRKYHLFDYFGAPDAERVVIIMGSGGPVCEEAASYLIHHGEKCGVIKVRLYRPWSAKHFLAALPETVKRIAVLDRTKENGSFGEPMYLDVTATLQEAERHVTVVGGRYGLGSKDFTPAMAKAVFDNLAAPTPKRHFTVGITDDVAHTSLEVGAPINYIPDGTVQCLFWGMGSDGTVSANKNSIKIIGDNTDLYAQAYFAYDAKKSGGVTVSHLRFGPEQITSPYLVKEADFVACHHPMYPDQYPILADIKKGGTFLFNTGWTDEEVEANFPNRHKRIIAERDVKFYILDALAVTNKIGLGKRINIVMQTAFFKLANVIPMDQAVPLMKAAIVKTFSKKGPEVVRMNEDAIDHAIAQLREFKYDAEKWAALPMDSYARVPEEAPDFVKRVIDPVIHREGDSLPVSAMVPGGFQPMGTTKYEKRGIAAAVPIWNTDKCTECNYCSLICPHAAIRPFLSTEEEIDNAPDTYVPRHAKGEGSGLLYRIQVSPLDCTGCELCVNACPDDALHMAPLTNEVIAREGQNWSFAMTVPDRAELFERNTVKGSQFQQPLLEFSGACEGCGETAYVKLVTQLFGERMIIANATGCSSIWGGSAPVTPYTVNKDGRGPAWANSLFEDNAEYGVGMMLANAHRRNKLAQIVEGAIAAGSVSAALKTELEGWLAECKSPEKAEIRRTAILPLLEKEKEGKDDLQQIWESRDMLPKISQWILGGDGWAYDIGYGGVDHVMSMGEDVNILVMDTELYSNTGGQVSKASPLSGVAKFAATGKRRNKKNLGLRGMSYEDVYVASISIEANMQQTVKALTEAEAFDGPSLIIAYSPCIEHGMRHGMKDSLEESKAAVDCGYWDLYRYNPTLETVGQNPFVLDSKKLRLEVTEFLKKQGRFSRLMRQMPEKADELHKDLAKFIKKRHAGWVTRARGTAAVEELAAPDLTILYASETGNAEDVAKRITADAVNRGLKCRCAEGDEVDPSDLTAAGTLLVVASTCGQGEVPQNARNFFKDMMDKGLAEDALKGVKYAVFGMGDSAYVFFNKTAKDLDRRFADLGGERLIDCGLGDDQDDEKFETALEDWLPDFWAAIKAPEPAGGLLPPTYTVAKAEAGVAPYEGRWMPHGTTMLKLARHELLTPPDYDRDMCHYELDLKGRGFKYSLGDAIGLYASNAPEVVADFLAATGLNGSDVVRIAPATSDTIPTRRRLPEVATVEQLFTEIVDIYGRPNKTFFKVLAQFANDEKEKAELMKLVSVDGKADFAKMVSEEMPNYVDVLKMFPSARPPLEYLIEMIPQIKPRLYSIASSQLAHPDTIELAIVLVDWKAKGVAREGLCTGFLHRIRGGDNVMIPAVINPGSITLPLKRMTPIVMAGLGTGMAPYRAIVQDSWHRKKTGMPYGPLCLFYGARHRKTDFIYGDWLESAAKDGVLTHLRPAFSRDQAYKIYVQDKIREDPALVYDLLVTQKGYFYFCGSAGRPPADCRKALVEALSKAGKISVEEADQYVTDMQISGRYVVEAY